MVIELLKFKVAPDFQENFIQKDAEIWTTALAEYPGFLGKEVWLNPNDASEVIFIIRWETFEHLDGIPEQELEAIEAKFVQALGKFYPIVESANYQVLKGLAD
ncbi:TIGR03792 family protein [Desmonostoc muscorum LEGE 12446]|uniref:TIGR03792 family protein n=1 Tax=Desmonostoc muscorum LEGE 12446 TaxID=1828758 RepID=A0A8J6ZV36_DESMC|nr:TIGR03792 family protein [Desmonostoc muscorum]MCF2149975.1 TIGR03792 family protein [Desmonostoc muscorum LEGE 12446]